MTKDTLPSEDNVEENMQHDAGTKCLLTEKDAITENRNEALEKCKDEQLPTELNAESPPTVSQNNRQPQANTSSDSTTTVSIEKEVISDVTGALPPDQECPLATSPSLYSKQGRSKKQSTRRTRSVKKANETEKLYALEADSGATSGSSGNIAITSNKKPAKHDTRNRTSRQNIDRNQNQPKATDDQDLADEKGSSVDNEREATDVRRNTRRTGRCRNSKNEKITAEGIDKDEKSHRKGRTNSGKDEDVISGSSDHEHTNGRKDKAKAAKDNQSAFIYQELVEPKQADNENATTSTKRRGSRSKKPSAIVNTEYAGIVGSISDKADSDCIQLEEDKVNMEDTVHSTRGRRSKRGKKSTVTATSRSSEMTNVDTKRTETPVDRNQHDVPENEISGGEKCAPLNADVATPDAVEKTSRGRRRNTASTASSTKKTGSSSRSAASQREKMRGHDSKANVTKETGDQKVQSDDELNEKQRVEIPDKMAKREEIREQEGETVKNLPSTSSDVVNDSLADTEELEDTQNSNAKSTLAAGRKRGRAKSIGVDKSEGDKEAANDSTLAKSKRRRTAADALSTTSTSSLDSQETLQTPSKTCRKGLSSPLVKSPALREGLREAQSRPKVMFTGLTDKQAEKCVKDLGGELVSSIYDATHLVTDKVRRTVKFLCSLARGINIVDTNWLDSCKDAKTFTPAIAFIIKDTASEKQFKFQLKKSIGKAREKPLLEGYQIYVSKNVKPDPKQMKDIVQCSGGKVINKIPKTSNDVTLIISCEDDKNDIRSAVDAGFDVFTAELLLTGILRQELLLDESFIEQMPYMKQAMHALSTAHGGVIS